MYYYDFYNVLPTLFILLSALLACQTVVSDTSCLVPDIVPIALEVERAEEAVELPVEREWQPNDVI